jgi:hypothetical protein
MNTMKTWMEIYNDLGGEKAAYYAYFDGTIPLDLLDLFEQRCYSAQVASSYRILRAAERIEALLDRIAPLLEGGKP